MGKIYYKLVRDRILDIIKNNDEYKHELENKLYEEYKEVIATTTSEERIFLEKVL